jgi:hypothetical protein
MDMFEKIGSWFQIVASVFFTLFSIFQVVRALFMRSEVFYIICFAAMLFIYCNLFRLSLAELKELKKGGRK